VTVQTSARHRAARRPSTPLSTLGRTVAGSAGVVSRRSAVIAASSGLVLTVAAPAAIAAPDTSALPAVDVQSLTQQARLALDVQPGVVVPADLEWTMAATEVTGEKPAPPPPPAPVRSTSASRSTERTSAAYSGEVTASGAAVLSIARRYIGVPYVYGGSTPAGFDCSGFTQYVFAQVGISLPRSSSAQRYAGRVVSAAEARPGDLVWGPGHVGIYTGNGNHIAARSPGTALYESPIYLSNPVFIRVLPD